ncbi:protein kinase domain-containing protein [Dokdonella ginsengisoli]|uniref:Protein kinase n=1 Tax=Dokdonella ginsengisoli TaxID=363846 RepID=A0ABV9QW62_9GAMM
MSGQRWQRLEDLFAQACDVPASARDAFVAQRCADDAALRDELAALLRAHDAAAEFLEIPRLKIDAIAVEAPNLLAGSRFGAWRVVRAIGRGGMGEVYEVSRAIGGFEQRAALKLLRHEAVAQIERFHAERSILARLDHPGIARLLDGGVADDGRPWAVLEYVEGRTITQWCEEHGADRNLRLELFLQACAAVAYAHRNLIVHRDLKPSNILVDGHGRVRLLDFGIAKLLDPAFGRSSDTTQMMLTPDYCAPEQLVGEPVTTATDVYVLGLLLYELLTGAKASPVHGLPIMRAMRALADPNTPKPSATALSLVDAPVPARLLRGDLDAIVARALRKEPAHRYATVDALRTDVERHLRNQPVAARSGARLYVFGRLLRRYRWVVAGVVALILALGAGLAGTVWQARRAEREARTATAVQDFLRDIFRANSSAQGDPVKARQTTVRELLDLGARKIDTAMADAPEAKLGVLQLLIDLYDDLWMPDERIRTLRQSEEITRKLYGAHSPQLAGVLTDLAGTLYSTSAAREGESLLREARAILDDNGDETSATRGNLLVVQAYFYGYIDVPYALDSARRAVRVFEAFPPSRDLAVAWYQLGLQQSRSGSLGQGIASLRRTIDMYDAEPGGRTYLMTAYRDLADMLLALPDFAGAERNARLALANALDTRGEDSLHAATARVMLGKASYWSGCTREGIDLLATAKAQAVAHSDPDNNDRRWAFQEHGRALAAAGDLDAGLADLETAVAMYRRRVFKEIGLADALGSIALAKIEAGRYEEARAAIDEDAAVRAAAGQKPSMETVDWVASLRGFLALAENRVDQARQALDDFATSGDAQAHSTLREVTRWLLEAKLHLRSSDFAGARRSVANARAEIEGSGQAGYLKRQASSADLLDGLALSGMGDASGALQPLQRALAAREELLLPMSQEIAEAQIALAECRLALGQLAPARELATRAQAIHSRHKELGEQYREPLRRLLQRLSAAGRR